MICQNRSSEIHFQIFLYLKEKGNNLKEKGEIADWTEKENVISHQYKLTIVTQREANSAFLKPVLQNA